IARELTMQDEFLVGRVIARPFIGENGAFERTANRHDYALKPFDKTVMNTLKDNDYDVVFLGKIVDIFDLEVIKKAICIIDIDNKVMIKISDNKYDVVSISKIVDIFYGKGITKAIHNIDNDDRIAKLKEAIKDDFEGLCFLNLVDFDSKYGHRRDPQGYGDAL